MDDAEVAALLAFGAPPRGTSASSNLNVYQDILGTVGNPVFLYTQGLVDADTLAALVRQSTREEIDSALLDYLSLEDSAKARQDQLAINGYNLIKGGASVAQVLREIVGEGASSAGKISDQLDYELRQLEDDLVEFKKRWDMAQQVESGVTTGEFSIIDGVAYKPKPTDQAIAALKTMGLPTFLQNPGLWEVIPDAKLLADAAAGQKQAATLAEELNRLVDKNGVLRRSVDRKAVNEAASKAGTDVYQMILNTAASGRQRAKDIAVSKERSDYELGMFGPTPASRAAASPPVAQSSQQRTKQLEAQNLAKWIANKVQELPKKETSAAILQRVAPTPEAQDYWAKMGGSYAARAAAEEQRKPVTTLQQRVKEAEKRAEEKAAAAYAAGRPLALDIIPQAMAAASMLAQPAPKPTYVKPKPRVLSDQEITMMATMLSGGNA